MGEGSDNIILVRDPIPLSTVATVAEQGFGDMVKTVVDVGRGVLALGGELHSDAEAVLIDDGATQSDLWGINLYPRQFGDPEWLEYDSLINIRPAARNRSRGVEAPALRNAIAAIVARLVVGDG